MFTGFINKITPTADGDFSITYNEFYNKSWKGFQCFSQAFDRILESVGVDANNYVIKNILSKVNTNGLNITNQQFYTLLAKQYKHQKY